MTPCIVLRFSINHQGYSYNCETQKQRETRTGKIKNGSADLAKSAQLLVSQSLQIKDKVIILDIVENLGQNDYYLAICYLFGSVIDEVNRVLNDPFVEGGGESRTVDTHNVSKKKISKLFLTMKEFGCTSDLMQTSA